MNSELEDLKEFHRKVGAFVAEEPMIPKSGITFATIVSIMDSTATVVKRLHESMKTGPNPQGEALAVLRARLMVEELAETLQAMRLGDLVGLADGLADLNYVVKGCAVTYGIPLGTVHDIVHASNMSKAPLNEHSKGGKGEGYVSPEKAIRELLADLGTPR